jgi:hypothetical protein
MWLTWVMSPDEELPPDGDPVPEQPHNHVARLAREINNTLRNVCALFISFTGKNKSCQWDGGEQPGVALSPVPGYRKLNERKKIAGIARKSQRNRDSRSTVIG